MIIAEGAHDSENTPISSDYVRQVLEDRLGEDTRVTILGHVQRGGAPSAFDRSMSSMVGYTAVEEVMAATPHSVPQLIGHAVQPGVQGTPDGSRRQDPRGRPSSSPPGTTTPRWRCAGDTYTEMVHIFHSMSHALPSVQAKDRPTRIAVLHVGGLAPGMNAAVHAAVRLGLYRGHTMLGVSGSFRGLIDGDVRELQLG